MFIELSKREQRYDVVFGVISDGFTITDLAQKFRVNRQSIHAWPTRYEVSGLDAVVEPSQWPDYLPAHIDPRVESRVVKLRRHYPSWRQIRLEHPLTKEVFDTAPSVSSTLINFVVASSGGGILRPRSL
ncbi:MAG: hypothetical protein KGJ10_02030 [Acidobacteriota bacterium]|nr:hypothetical protein [Acidobacteriota bacterium]MDE3043590.1 hypothetical protein [Acidobacteriota bacterium]MDE3222596.1 hypothetical protein [Acidobacteriota bacterium]